MNILLIRRGALGDSVVTLPLLQILREKYKDCHIEVIGDSGYWSLAYPNYIDKITSSDSKYINSLFLQDSLDKETVQYYKNFDLILGFLIDRDGTVKKYFSQSGIENYLLKEPFTEDTQMHIVKYTTSILDDAHIDYHDYKAPKIDIERSGTVFAEKLFNQLGYHKKLISIHPRTYGIKGLTLDKFIELGRWVEDELKGIPIWILGPVEYEIREQLEFSFDKKSVIAENDLKKVAAIISATDFYVGCDTGITHLAAATGVDTITIFGPTNPDIWGSLGDNVKIIKTDNLGAFDTGIVKHLIINNINSGFTKREIIQT
ncbi:MAG: hypothetical protein GWN11_04130 [Candidatus Dadabacteria bacterium]|nr:hypothetical protein [Candidatus Dadabacteria bacterium]NIX15071.1 hypothetical protein [Candidatus Dadabacteria bacterium]